MPRRGKRPGDARKGTRAPNWTPPELKILFLECARNPQVALGLDGNDLRSRKHRHDFFARIADRVSALGLAVRDGNASQRRFMEGLKGPKDQARLLMKHGATLTEAIDRSVAGAGQHMHLLIPLLHTYIQTAQFGTDTLASSTSSAATSDQILKALPDFGNPDSAQPTGTPALTGHPFDALDHSLTGTWARQQFQDDAMSVDLDDDVSVASSGEDGLSTGSGSQAMPTVQGALEGEDANPHESGDNAAHGGPRPTPVLHSQDPTMRPPPRARRVAAAAHGGDAANDNDMTPVHPHARGPRAPAPLPTTMGGLWSQVQQDLTESGQWFQDATQRLLEAWANESAEMQTAMRGCSDAVDMLATNVRQLTSSLHQIHVQSRKQTSLLREQTGLLRQLVAAPRGAGRAAQHAGQGCGQGQDGGQGGSVPALKAEHARDQEAAVSEGEPAAEDEKTQQRGRPHHAQDSFSSPPHPPKRHRRQ